MVVNLGCNQSPVELLKTPKAQAAPGRSDIRSRGSGTHSRIFPAPQVIGMCGQGREPLLQIILPLEVKGEDQDRLPQGSVPSPAPQLPTPHASCDFSTGSCFTDLGVRSRMGCHTLPPWGGRMQWSSVRFNHLRWHRPRLGFGSRREALHTRPL